ncbi:MAG: DICT sensory domain-containing protein [Candidatus Methylacidiphilales bacterium]
MIIETTSERRTRKRFQKVLTPYLDSGESHIRSVAPHAKSGKAKHVQLGDRVHIPETDITHLFNNQAMLAVSHAIEDLASETREGELISTFQKFENFKPQKKRYLGLAKDLDAVRVWGEGVPPTGCGKIDFIPVHREEMKRYWVVLFASSETHAALICRQVNESSSDFNKKIFAGFYTFNPFLVESLRRHLNLMSVGLDNVVERFNQRINIPSLSLRDIRQYFDQAK